MASTPPQMTGVLETVLYYTGEEATERFYGEVLGLRLLSREPGRNLFYRAGESVFLLFFAPGTLQSENVPPHGASGPGHTCFLVPPDEYEGWKQHLEASGVEILQETDWSPGLSFYFHDPSGNVLEIANRDIWPE